MPFEDMAERMLFIEAIETVKCVDEGVLRSTAEANIGSIFGIGFPAWTGGVLQYINGYDGGPAGFVARARNSQLPTATVSLRRRRWWLSPSPAVGTSSTCRQGHQ